MRELFHWLLAIPVKITTIGQTHLVWTTPWKKIWVILFLLTAFVWFFIWYYKDGTKPTWWSKSVLLALRITVLIALMLLMFQPTVKLTHTHKIMPSSAVLVDVSSSMNRTDPHLPPAKLLLEERATGLNAAQILQMPRLARINALLNHQHILTLLKGTRLHFYTFASSSNALPVPSTASKKPYQFNIASDPHGDSTQIGTALQQMEQDVSGQPLAGTLIISDGENNLGTDPLQVARSLNADGMKVSTMGVGDPTPTKDVAVISVLGDDNVRLNNVVSIFGELMQRGYAGKAETVTLLRNGKPFMSRVVALAKDNMKQVVKFTFQASQTGKFVYSVVAAHQPDEVTYSNNSRAIVQTVIKKRLRVLYIENRPRWEYRYLRSAILKDANLRFSCLLLKGDDMGNGGEGNLPINSIPTDEKKLFDYDIIILGDVPRSAFTDQQLTLLRNFVEFRGGSLLIIAGQNHMPWEYAGTPLEPVIPVAFGSEPESISPDNTFPWRLTADGERSSIMQLSDNPSRNLQIWSSLPGMNWAARVQGARPAASVLAVDPQAQNGQAPLAVLQSFGAGLCYSELTDNTWEWRWKVGDRYFYRYWGQVLRALTPKELPGNSHYVEINTDRTTYRLGQSATVSVRLLDRYYHPVVVPHVSATVHMVNGQEQKILLQSTPGSPGLYTTLFQPPQTGRYSISLSSPQTPSAHASTTFVVESIALEDQKPELDERYLKELAFSGGGKYYEPNELAKWAASLNRKPFLVKQDEEVEVWDSPLLLFLIVTPLVLEWLLRKRKGLL